MRKDNFIESRISGKILVSDNKYFCLPAFLLFYYIFPIKMRKKIFQQALRHSLATARD